MHILWKPIPGLSSRAPPCTLNASITFNSKIATTPKHIVKYELRKKFTNPIKHATHNANRYTNGVQEILVDVIECIYNGSMIRLEISLVSYSGVSRGCPLSPQLFNIYVRELGMQVETCKQKGFKYLVINTDGVIEEKSQTGFRYAEDVCLMTSHEQDLQIIFDNISRYISEYDM